MAIVEGSVQASIQRGRATRHSRDQIAGTDHEGGGVCDAMGGPFAGRETEVCVSASVFLGVVVFMLIIFPGLLIGTMNLHGY